MKLGEKNPFSFQMDYEHRVSVFSHDLDHSIALAGRDEKAAQTKMRPSTSFVKDAFKRFFHNPVAVVFAIIIVLVIVLIIVAPLFCPYTYSEQLPVTTGDSTYNNLAPFAYSVTEQAKIAAGQFVFPHLFGTDSLGRDYFIRVIYATRVSLIVGFFASIIVLIVGSLYGSISGYAGGRTDMIMMRIVDVIYSLPDIIVIILLSVILKQVLGSTIDNSPLGSIGFGMISIFIVFALLYWVGMARLVRGQILTIKEQEYVLAARSIGASPWFIIRKHLLPNSMSIIIISAGLQIPEAIFTESFLSFIGLGVSAPMPSLGSLANDSLAGMMSYPYRLFIPALVICLIVLSLNLVGDGLRDAFDPKLQR